jgi:hypothetical protein
MTDDLVDQQADNSIWSSVVARLREEFPSVRSTEIAGLLVDARRGVALFGLAADGELAMTERIARAQLEGITTAALNPRSSARLDPQTHRRKAPEVVDDETRWSSQNPLEIIDNREHRG